MLCAIFVMSSPHCTTVAASGAGLASVVSEGDKDTICEMFWVVTVSLKLL